MEEFGIDSDYLSYSASLSRNGEWVLLNQIDGYEYLLDLTSPKEMRAWILPKAGISQRIAQDILVKVFDNHVLIWDLSIGSRSHIPSLIKFDDNIVAMDYCSRTKRFVFGLDDGRIAMVEWDDHRRLRIQSSFQAHDKQVRAVAVSQDGRFIASSGYDDFKPYVKLWQRTKDNGEWRPIILSQYTPPVDTIQFSPDGQWLAAGTKDNLVLIYSTKIDVLTKLALRVAGRGLKEEEQNLSSLSRTK
jgi:WD40 repeat protein